MSEYDDSLMPEGRVDHVWTIHVENPVDEYMLEELD
jgi:hypothetical protein